MGKKHGVYHIAADLQAQFGVSRVFNTLLEEQTILGTAIGLAYNGFSSPPEIQFLAYLHNAIDQIREEAPTSTFFDGQYTNPMVVRVPALAYQKGFSGHFHNENAITFLREISGFVMVCPSQAQDAALLLRQSIQLAYQAQRVVIFLEPIALCMRKDLYELGDNGALQVYPTPEKSLAFAELGIEGDNKSSTIIMSYGNRMHLARQAAWRLKLQYELSGQLIDLRWLAPVATENLKSALEDKQNILVVDECREIRSLSEWLITWMYENLPIKEKKIDRLTVQDCFIPTGNAWEYLLPSCQQIIEKILTL